jgi:hypothetical protein
MALEIEPGYLAGRQGKVKYHPLFAEPS